LYELEYFTCDEFSDTNADIIICVTDSVTSGVHFRRSIAADESAGSYKVRYSEHFGFVGAEFSINFSDRIEISVNILISLSKHVLYANLVEPILRFLMISKGYVLLHSGCMDLDGQGILLSAPADTGKTTTVLRCLKRGFSFLSDDMTIIRLPEEALCFPKPISISTDTFETAVLSNTSFGAGIKLRSLVHSKGGRQFMRKLGRYNVPIFTINAIGQAIINPPKSKIEDLVPSVKIQDRTKVVTLCFLQVGGEEIAKLPADIALTKMIENSDDAFFFPPYKEMLRYINIDRKSAQDLLQEEKNMLEKFLSGVNSLIIKSDSRSWYKLVDRIVHNDVTQ
jgi:hypothetical protein